MTDVTQILSRIEKGDPSAAEHLLPLVYEELRKLAAARLAKPPDRIPEGRGAAAFRLGRSRLRAVCLCRGRGHDRQAHRAVTTRRGQKVEGLPGGGGTCFRASNQTTLTPMPVS